MLVCLRREFCLRIERLEENEFDFGTPFKIEEKRRMPSCGRASARTPDIYFDIPPTESHLPFTIHPSPLLTLVSHGSDTLVTASPQVTQGLSANQEWHWDLGRIQ